ncbi:hypothetical protein V1289_000442 [Bradyrhizobium sp. AZCC 2289]
MATNKPIGDNARRGAVRKRTQLRSKTMSESTWTKRDKNTGRFHGSEEGAGEQEASAARRRRADRQGIAAAERSAANRECA